jgi:hypothetical protein
MEWSLVEQIIPIISEVRFPIVVTLYLRYQIESRLALVSPIDTKFARPNEGVWLEELIHP